MRILNVVVMGNTFIEWGGGVDFIRFVLNGFSAISHEIPIKLFLLLPDNSIVARVRRQVSYYRNVIKGLASPERSWFLHFGRTRIDHKPVLDCLSNVIGKFEPIFFDGSHSSLKRILKRVNASVLLPSIGCLGNDFPFPWVGYISDFQHMYYPEFFSRQEIDARNRNFERMVNESPALIVNSQSVQTDIQKFYPNHRSRIFALPFSPCPVDTWFDPPRENIGEKYKLPKGYFMISNQFWIHKDHKTAFKALAHFHSLTGKSDISIVCTGQKEDSRFPGYFSELMQEVHRLGLNERIIILGYIPKLDQINIMKGCIALLQPSLFEGGPGGGAVYDSVALGIPAIVSDVPVNREIIEDSVTFFVAGDPEDLAAKMAVASNLPNSPIDRDVQIATSRLRMAQFGKTLMQSVRAANKSCCVSPQVMGVRQETDKAPSEADARSPERPRHT